MESVRMTEVVRKMSLRLARWKAKKQPDLASSMVQKVVTLGALGNGLKEGIR